MRVDDGRVGTAQDTGERGARDEQSIEPWSRSASPNCGDPNSSLCCASSRPACWVPCLCSARRGGGSILEWHCFRQRLTLGTTCILAAGCYIDGDDTRPREGRRTRGDSGFVKVVVCIVRALRGGKRVLGGNEMLECAENAGTFLSTPSAACEVPKRSRLRRS